MAFFPGITEPKHSYLAFLQLFIGGPFPVPELGSGSSHGNLPNS
jgi:hypothetical protein